MKTRYFLPALIALLSGQIALADGTFPVTLKVIDKTGGEITNNVNDNNETNVYCWISDGISTESPDWWDAMYNDATYGKTGELIKTDDSWIWQITVQAPVGTHEWNPSMKTLGWKEINKNVAYFGEGNRIFTVAEDGSVSGDTEVVLNRPSGNKTSVKLAFVDQSTEKKSNNPGGTEDRKNIVVEGNGNLWQVINAESGGNWLYGMYTDETTFPLGNLVETDNELRWEVTFQLDDNTVYAWRPRIQSWGCAIINEGFYTYQPGGDGFIYFSIDEEGNITGETELVMASEKTNYNLTLNVDMNGTTVDAAGVHVAGSFNSWNTTTTELTDADGDGVYSVTISVPASNEPYQYKFLNGNAWGKEEIVFGECAYRTNRIAYVTDGDVTMPVSVFGYCGTTPELKGIRVACIGDSNTEGAGASDVFTQSWPIQMRDFLGEEYYTENLGVSGATLMKLPDPWGAWTNDVSECYSHTKLFNPDVILIALGTNDSKTGYWGTRDFQADYTELIEEFRNYPSQPEIYMITPIKAFENGYGISDDNIRNGVIPAINELSKNLMVPVIDWYAETASLTQANDIPDGVHANDATLRIMAEKAAEIMLMTKPVVIANASSSAEYAGYRWYLNGAYIENSDRSTYTATESGTYHVAVKIDAASNDVIVSEGIRITASESDPVTLGINNATGMVENVSAKTVGIAAFENHLKIYDADNAAVRIYTVAGVEVKAVSHLNGSVSIDLSDLPNGIYVCRLNEANGTRTLKFAK